MKRCYSGTRDQKPQWTSIPKRFHELTVKSRDIELELKTLARYLSGLKIKLQKEMLTVGVYNVEEAYQLVLQLER